MNAGAATQPTPPDPTTKSPRRRELDLLGTIIVFSLVFLHTASIFSGQQLVVNKAQGGLTTILAALIVSWDVIWTMPVMMLIAGMTIWYSLGTRTVGEFIRDRVRRLLVPFVTGMVLLLPPMVYYAMLFFYPSYAESFWQFYPRFWNIQFSLPAFPLFFAGAPASIPGAALSRPIFEISHLWFVIYLFVYALLMLPLWLYLRGAAGQAAARRFASVFARPWLFYLLALPVAFVEAFLATDWPGGWSRFVWPFFIVYGFLIAGDERFSRTLVARWRGALVLGIIGFGAYFAGMGMQMSGPQPVDPFTSSSAIAVAVRFIKGLDSWFWVIAVLGLATSWGQRQARKVPGGATAEPGLIDRLAAYGREAQLPVYVLHQTPIIVLGYYVVQWQVSSLIKFLVISVASLVVTLLVYEIGVRRTAVTRFLFGMRPRKQA